MMRARMDTSRSFGTPVECFKGSALVQESSHSEVMTYAFCLAEAHERRKVQSTKHACRKSRVGMSHAETTSGVTGVMIVSELKRRLTPYYDAASAILESTFVKLAVGAVLHGTTDEIHPW